MAEYTELGKKLPKGQKLYQLCLGISFLTGVAHPPIGDFFSSFPGISQEWYDSPTMNPTYSQGDRLWTILHMPIGAINLPDIILNLTGSMNASISESNDAEEKTLDDPIISLCKTINRKVRLPIFLVATACVGKTIYDCINTACTGQPIDENTFHYAGIGISYLGNASSMYLKDQDDDAGKRAYDKLKEWGKNIKKMFSEKLELLPSPTKYTVLDNHTQAI